MHNTKCPNCGLVNFSSAEKCKRCQKDISDVVDVAEKSKPEPVKVSSVRIGSDYPLAAWVVTFALVMSIVGTSLTFSKHSGSNAARAFGEVIGSLIAWPMVLIIVYGVSRRFREKYSFHAVMNYGLAINMVVASMTLPFK
jgi:hypothetical protein